MPRKLMITRDEGEMLVELLEADQPKNLIRQELAAEIRELFGMIPRDEEERARRES